MKVGLRDSTLLTTDGESFVDAFSNPCFINDSFCLIAFKGNPIFNGSSERDIIRESRREHSRKPDAFYQYVERSTIGRKLEYFSREKRTNWEIYGNEVNKFWK